MTTVRASSSRLLIAVGLACLAVASCAPKGERRQADAKSATGAEPCVTEPCRTTPGAATPGGDIPRFAAGSPFGVEYKPPVMKDGKRIWAKNLLFEKAPELVVEKWLTDKPDIGGKVVLYEFWATWCPPCRRSIDVLNRFHEKYGKELVVIGISDETEADVRKLKTPQIRYYSAIDTQARMKNEVGVFGIPHVLLVEPGGHIVWQGFPLLPGYELTEATIEKILAVSRAQPKP